MDNEATTAKLADGRAVRVAIQGCVSLIHQLLKTFIPSLVRYQKAELDESWTRQSALKLL